MADDERTDEQKIADEHLRAAISEVVMAYGNMPGDAILQDFIVQGRGLRWDDNGDKITHIFTAFTDGSLDPITIAGHATAAFFKWGMYAADVTRDGDEG
jgi:hypothetical protein